VDHPRTQLLDAVNTFPGGAVAAGDFGTNHRPVDALRGHGCRRFDQNLSKSSIFAKRTTPVVPNATIDMMRTLYHTTRWLVTTSLIVSLGLAGLFPQMMVLAENGTRVAFPQPSGKCCCGTEDGRCCGMGCCVARQAPAKERCPSPNPKDTRDGQNNPLSLALAKNLIGGDGEIGGLGLRHPENRILRSLAECSLQVKHVRIDA